MLGFVFLCESGVHANIMLYLFLVQAGKGKKTINMAGNNSNKEKNTMASLFGSVSTKLSQLTSTCTKKVSDFSITTWRWTGPAPQSGSSYIGAAAETRNTGAAAETRNTTGTQQPGPSVTNRENSSSRNSTEWSTDVRSGTELINTASQTTRRVNGGNNNH